MPADPLLLGLVAAASVLLAGRGLALVQSPPPGRLGLEPDAPTPSRRPPVTALLESLGGRFGPVLLRRLSAARRERLLTRLALAGFPGQAGLESYSRRKAGYVALFGGLGVLLVLLGSPLIGLLLVVIGWFWVDLVLLSRGRLRQEELERQMADFLDILAVTVSAGLSFRSALGRVGAAIGGPLGAELDITLRQLDLGESRRNAFLAMRDRNESDSLRIFVGAFLQAEELGAPLAQTLVEISADIRREGAQMARRKAARTVPRVSLIVSFLMVPAAVILLGVGLYLSAGDGLEGVLGP